MNTVPGAEVDSGCSGDFLRFPLTLFSVWSIMNVVFGPNLLMGVELMEQESFCNVCGTPLVNGVCPKCTPQYAHSGAGAAPGGFQQPGMQNAAPGGFQQPGMQNAAPGGFQQPGMQNAAPGGFQQLNMQKPAQGGDFGTPDESLIMKIGSGYVENFLSGVGMRNNTAILTNKRVYYSGKSYASFGIGVKRCKAVQSVDLKDITGTGIYSVFNLALMIIGIIIADVSLVLMLKIYGAFLIPLIIGLLFIVIPFFTARTMLRIDYAGGYIAINMRKFSRAECTAFQKAVMAAKDNITDYR